MEKQLASLLERMEAAGAQAELFQASFDSLEVRFTAGVVKNALAREASGLSLRAIRDGRLGFVGSRDTSPEGLERLVGNVENSLEVGDPARIAFPGPSEPPVDPDSLEGHDEATAALEVADLVATGQEALDVLRERHPGMTFDAVLRRSVGTARLRNSNKLDCQDRYTVYSIVVEANRTRDEDVLMDYTYATAAARSRIDPARMVDDISRRLTWAKETVELRPGRMPVLFTPQGSLLVWSPLLQGLSGKTVLLGTSPLRDRLGETIFSQEIQLTDDGLLPGGLGSSPFDDEGTPRRTLTLVEDGVLKSFVHDLETSAATGQDPTGNGERGGATAKPGPGYTNVLIRGGETPLDELMKGIDYGLLVHSVMGMGQGNTLPGTFSNPVDLAYLIEGGEVKGRVKDVSLAGNIYELLKDQLGGLSREVEIVSGAYHVPWLLLNDMNVVGKGSSA